MNNIELDYEVVNVVVFLTALTFLGCSVFGVITYISTKDNEWRSKNFQDTLNTTMACRKVVVKDTDKICGAVPVWSQFSGESK